MSASLMSALRVMKSNPRKGTETITVYSFVFAVQKVMKSNPRKGTETKKSMTMAHTTAPVMKSNPRKGTETQYVVLAISSVKRYEI